MKYISCVFLLIQMVCFEPKRSTTARLRVKTFRFDLQRHILEWWGQNCKLVFQSLYYFWGIPKKNYTVLDHQTGSRPMLRHVQQVLRRECMAEWCWCLQPFRVRFFSWVGRTFAWCCLANGVAWHRSFYLAIRQILGIAPSQFFLTQNVGP